MYVVAVHSYRTLKCFSAVTYLSFSQSSGEFNLMLASYSNLHSFKQLRVSLLCVWLEKAVVHGVILKNVGMTFGAVLLTMQWPNNMLGLCLDSLYLQIIFDLIA